MPTTSPSENLSQKAIHWHAVRVLELEKAREKLKSKAMAVRLRRAEFQLKRCKGARHD